MAEAARILPVSDQNQSEKAKETGKSQLPGESALWFRRYCLYRDLGHKRSLRAAVAKERETAHLVEEPKTAPKSPKTKKVAGVDVSLSKAPEPALNVPGSWKHASKVYRWQERARAFDAYLIDMMVTHTYAHLGDTYANKYKRVQLLELLLKGAVDQLNNATANGATHSTYLAYLKQIAALTAQMEHEISAFSEEEMKGAIGQYGRAIRDEIEKACKVGLNVPKKA